MVLIVGFFKYTVKVNTLRHIACFCHHSSDRDIVVLALKHICKKNLPTVTMKSYQQLQRLIYHYCFRSLVVTNKITTGDMDQQNSHCRSSIYMFFPSDQFTSATTKNPYINLLNPSTNFMIEILNL